MRKRHDGVRGDIGFDYVRGTLRSGSISSRHQATKENGKPPSCAGTTNFLEIRFLYYILLVCIIFKIMVKYIFAPCTLRFLFFVLSVHFLSNLVPVAYEKTEIVPPSNFSSKTNVHLRHWVPKNLKPRTQFFTHRFQQRTSRQHCRKCRGWTLVLDGKSDGGTISVFSYTTGIKIDKK
jgi:hypothetical protein